MEVRQRKVKNTITKRNFNVHILFEVRIFDISLALFSIKKILQRKLQKYKIITYLYKIYDMVMAPKLSNTKKMF